MGTWHSSTHLGPWGCGVGSGAARQKPAAPPAPRLVDAGPGPPLGTGPRRPRGGRRAAACRRRSDRHPASPREPCGLVRGAHDRVAFTAEAIKVAWATEGAHPLTLEFRDCPALPGGPGVITGVPVSGSWRQKRQRPSDVMGGGPRLPLPALQREWRREPGDRPGTRSPPSFWGGGRPWRHGASSPEICLGLLTRRSVR